MEHRPACTVQYSTVQYDGSRSKRLKCLKTFAFNISLTIILSSTKAPRGIGRKAFINSITNWCTIETVGLLTIRRTHMFRGCCFFWHIRFFAFVSSRPAVWLSDRLTGGGASPPVNLGDYCQDSIAIQLLLAASPGEQECVVGFRSPSTLQPSSSRNPFEKNT